MLLGAVPLWFLYLWLEFENEPVDWQESIITFFGCCSAGFFFPAPLPLFIVVLLLYFFFVVEDFFLFRPWQESPWILSR